MMVETNQRTHRFVQFCSEMALVIVACREFRQCLALLNCPPSPVGLLGTRATSAGGPKGPVVRRAGPFRGFVDSIATATDPECGTYCGVDVPWFVDLRRDVQSGPSPGVSQRETF